MKLKTLILILGLLAPLGTISAQHQLEKETTEPRIGDEYVKTEMEFFPVEKVRETGKNEKKNWNLLKPPARRREGTEKVVFYKIFDF